MLSIASFRHWFDYATCCSDVLHPAAGTVKRRKCKYNDTTENKRSPSCWPAVKSEKILKHAKSATPVVRSTLHSRIGYTCVKQNLREFPGSWANVGLLDP